MKVLIAYDGSRCSEAALDDLCTAGFPERGQALVVSVAEVWLPPPPGEENDADPYIESIVSRYREKGERLLAEAETFARHAHSRVSKSLPDWDVDHRSSYGSPAWEILACADEFKPDLIVVGSHGQSAFNRIVLGSISHKVLTEASCSVRVARGRVQVDPTPVRVVVGYDASPGSNVAVDEVLRRDWPASSEFRLVTATDPVMPSAIGRFLPPITDWTDAESAEENKWIRARSEAACGRISEKGFAASLKIIEGNPNAVLIKEAEGWNADCIFVGANAYGGRIERFLLGSTSGAVAARAHCSVEVVRRPASV